MSALLWLTVPAVFLALSASRSSESKPGKKKPGGAAPPPPGPGPKNIADFPPPDFTPGGNAVGWSDLTDSPFLLSLPADHTGGTNDPRDVAIFEEVLKRAKAGQLPETDLKSDAWTNVFVSAGPLAARVPVLRDALKLDGVRVNASFELMQRLADALGVYQITDRVADAIHQQATARIAPSLHGGKGDWMDRGEGAWTRHMLEHSLEVDGRIGQSDDPNGGLVTNEGKHWIIHPRNWETANPHTVPPTPYLDGPHGVNFGWYKSASPSNLGKWQGPGNAHNIWHADYSQIARFMGPVIYLQSPQGEVPVHVAEALTNKEFAPLLLNTKAPLPDDRHPMIPQDPPIA